ncbi:unnamed protein product [Nippostrongylus brasiliensis]|uniref:G_PROTEIN_RECEP_F1_2 domain-containing protein n=1 Tax=Nippostrongylus brasiliensis TaxID=27835 RepID=A0A158R1Y8_NIPBR|nr:unnamed protein product [Nippostrongylus brasiliensis]
MHDSSWSAGVRDPDGLSTTFAMGMISFLIVDIVILILQAASIIFNGVILYMFISDRTPAGLTKLSIPLRWGYLAPGLFGKDKYWLALPYIIYLTALWNPTYIDLDPTYIMISSTPLPTQLKINLTLTIALALERCLALYFPATYRRLPSYKYAAVALTVGCVLAALDLTIEFMLAPFKRVPNCAAIGCFLSDQFLYYWGTSNMVMGIIVVVLTLLLMGKLQLIQRNSRVGQQRAERDANRFRTANNITLGILIVSLMFVTMPSVGVGFVEMLGYSIFKNVGPFYIVGLLSAGASNSFIYVLLNRDMRQIWKSAVFCRKVEKKSFETTRAVYSIRMNGDAQTGSRN